MQAAWRPKQFSDPNEDPLLRSQPALQKPGHGRRADLTNRTPDDIVKIANAQSGAVRAFDVITVHLAPRQVVVALSVDFMDCLSASDIDQAVAAIESLLKQKHREVVAVL